MSAKSGQNPIFTAGLLLVALKMGVVWLQSAPYEALAVGKPAPDFPLTDLNGTRHRLSDFRGKIVFLNFWATWCKPCREEMPSMEALQRQFEKSGLVILAVSVDRANSRQEISPFVQAMRLTFPVLSDVWGKTDKSYRRVGVPETFLIDQEGIVREIVRGPRDWTRSENLETLTKLLQRAVVHSETPSLETQS